MKHTKKLPLNNTKAGKKVMAKKMTKKRAKNLGKTKQK
jgi:hypothetical protein